MNVRSKSFLSRWIISTIAVLAAEKIVPGIHYLNWTDLFIATLLLGILNTFLKPILMVLSLPLVVLTLGLFLVVINALMLLLVDMLVPNFKVDGFWSAFFGALVISIISLILNSFFGTKEPRVEAKRDNPIPPSHPRDDGSTGSGPIIDV